MQVHSLAIAIHAACFQERIEKHARENQSFATIAPARHDRQRRNCSAFSSRLWTLRCLMWNVCARQDPDSQRSDAEDPFGDQSRLGFQE